MDLVSRWKLNEQSGTTIADSVGSNDGTWVGTELITNGDFSAWSGAADPDNLPDDWDRGTSVTPDGNNKLVDATNACQLISDGSLVEMTQSILTTGKKYTVSLNISAITGSLSIQTGTTSHVSYTTTGVKVINFVAEGIKLILKRIGAGPHDITFTDVSVRETVVPRFSSLGTGLLFDGVGDKITVSDSASLDVTAVTMSAWINLDSGWSANGYILAKLEDVAAGGEISYTMHITDARKVALGISNDGDDAVAESSNDAISLSVWHHIAGTYDTGTYKIYVDGVLVASDGNGNASGTIHVGTGRLTLGARYDSSDVAYRIFFKGIIGDVRIYNTVLSDSDIKQIVAEGHARGTRTRFDNSGLSKNRERGRLG